MIINKHREVSMETEQKELRLDDEEKENGAEEGGDDKDDTTESD